MRIILCLTSLTVLFGCNNMDQLMIEDFYKVYTSEEDIRTQLKKVSESSIFFGHQSVGYNIVAGIEQLVNETDIHLEIAESRSLSDVVYSSFTHFRVGENLDPIAKIDDFEMLVGEIQRDKPAIAFFKFCYVDITETTDINILFDYYKEKMYFIKDNHPNVRIVLMTAPYIALQRGAKAIAKRMMFMPLYGELGNINKYIFNEKMIKELGNDFPIFDLARVESTLPDGSLTTHKYKGESYPALSYVYTDDMGHLNTYGSKVAAYNLITFLAHELE